MGLVGTRGGPCGCVCPWWTVRVCVPVADRGVCVPVVVGGDPWQTVWACVPVVTVWACVARGGP